MLATQITRRLLLVKRIRYSPYHWVPGGGCETLEAIFVAFFFLIGLADLASPVASLFDGTNTYRHDLRTALPRLPQRP